jgi:thiamine-monophosphate kinase
MKVAEIGEFGLIDLLSGLVSTARDSEQEAWRQLILGIGDDAAAWQGDSRVQLATTDLLIEGVHFTLDMTSWEELGWRAMAANLSDIAAMGGLPRYALVSLALPGQTEVDDVTALYKGMIGLAQQFGTAIVGGDVSSAPQLVINIAILGSSVSWDILTRSAARVGEKIAVTGYLGASAAGLEMLREHLSFDSESTSALREAFLKPYPRVVEGGILVEHGVIAAIDISDGLISDLGHICEMSKVSARVEIDKVPVHPAVKAHFGDRALRMALSGGEDYELLFTASTEVIDQVKEAVSCPVTVIGEIVAGEAGEVTLIDEKGSRVYLPGTGWEHFGKK